MSRRQAQLVEIDRMDPRTVVIIGLVWTASAQAAPRKSLAELVNQQDPAWPVVQEAVAGSHGRARILPTTRARGEKTLLAMQYTTQSIVGAIAYETGGIAVDSGWLRVLGAGGPELSLDLAKANGLDKQATLAADAPGIIVAVDVLGGVFAINTGKLPGPADDVFYLAPDTLEWLDLGRRYSGFVQWALGGDLDQFYRALRWPTWKKDLHALSLDSGLHVLPPLFIKADAKVPVSRKPVPIDELWRLTIDLAEQTRAKKIKPGDKVLLKVVK
jgi:hypothetical protein